MGLKLRIIISGIRIMGRIMPNVHVCVSGGHMGETQGISPNNGTNRIQFRACYEYSTLC